MPWNTPVTALRQADLDLRRLAADIGQRQEQAGEQDAERVQPAEEGDDDRGEAVAGRDRGDELADRTGHLEHAGEAGEAAAEQQAQPDRSLAGGSRRSAPAARRLADDLDLEADDGARHQHPGGDRDDERDQRRRDAARVPSRMIGTIAARVNMRDCGKL